MGGLAVRIPRSGVSRALLCAVLLSGALFGDRAFATPSSGALSPPSNLRADVPEGGLKIRLRWIPTTPIASRSLVVWRSVYAPSTKGPVHHIQVPRGRKSYSFDAPEPGVYSFCVKSKLRQSVSRCSKRATVTLTGGISDSGTPTPTPTPFPGPSASGSPTPATTASATATPTSTPALTRTPTRTPTPTVTPTPTSTRTPTPTPSSTPTSTPTARPAPEQV